VTPKEMPWRYFQLKKNTSAVLTSISKLAFPWYLSPNTVLFLECILTGLVRKETTTRKFL
jgi:hypothetical protein